MFRAACVGCKGQATKHMACRSCTCVIMWIAGSMVSRQKYVLCCHVVLTPGCSHSIGAKFVPTPEERLLSVVHALLHRCYKLPFSNAATVSSIHQILLQFPTKHQGLLMSG
jgi:hypothetical protein